jgi:hypothetical protein
MKYGGLPTFSNDNRSFIAAGSSSPHGFQAFQEWGEGRDRERGRRSRGKEFLPGENACDVSFR